jgi:cell pole-organizing protein PopZ
MAEAAKTQEPSMEELRARIRRIIVETDEKSAERRTESSSPKSDAAAPLPTQAPLLGRAQQLEPGSYASSADRVSAAAISDCSSTLLNAAAAIATPQSTGTSSDPAPTAASASGLYAGESDSPPPFDHGRKQVPMPSSMLDAASGAKEPQEPVGERAAMPSQVSDAAPDRHVSDAAPGREERGERRFSHAGQQLATLSRGRDSAPAPGGEDWEQLISPGTNNAVLSAFNALAQTVLLHNAQTLEDMVREMLRPILKVWLDDNLPILVERLVRAEIERAQRPAHGKLGDR